MLVYVSRNKLLRLGKLFVLHSSKIFTCLAYIERQSPLVTNNKSITIVDKKKLIDEKKESISTLLMFIGISKNSVFLFLWNLICKIERIHISRHAIQSNYAKKKIINQLIYENNNDNITSKSICLFYIATDFYIYNLTPFVSAVVTNLLEPLTKSSS